MIKFLRPALIVLLMLCQNFSMAATADYLPADLRSRVDQLKADLDNIPTTPTNVRARAKLTWEWLNAYAINGGYSPVNASQVIATILSGEPVGAGGIKALNEAINELALADSQPDALGVLTADSGPFVAGSQATIRQTYTVGALDIQTGGGFMVARHFMPDFGPWQNTDPDGENYISISTSNPRVGFVASTAPLSGMHGGFRASRPTMVFEVASALCKRMIPSPSLMVTPATAARVSPYQPFLRTGCHCRCMYPSPIARSSSAYRYKQFTLRVVS